MLRTDLRIFKSERMTQQPDAGGQRTSNEVINGKLNEVFGNISDIDHAQSAFDIVKIYPAVSTADTALLQDGHFYLNEPPLDAKVDVMIIESAAFNDGSERADIINAIESSMVPSLALRRGLSEMIAGQDQINILDLRSGAADTGEQPNVNLNMGGIYVISVEYTGDEDANWPRFQHFFKVVEITASAIRIEPPLPLPAPGRSRLINGQNRCTVLRDITTGAGVKYHGVTSLTADSAGTTLQVETTRGRVTPQITESVARLANVPFQAESGLNRKQVDIPAVGIVYTLNVSDFIKLWQSHAVEVLYISGGKSYTQTYTEAAITAGQLEFAIQRTPDAGTNVQVRYFSNSIYSLYSFPDAIPAGYTLQPETIYGDALAASFTRYIINPDPSEPGRLLVNRVDAAANPYQEVAAIINLADGTPTYFNGYTNLAYNAVVKNDTAAESTTSAKFVVPFNQVLPATFYVSVQRVAGGLLSAAGNSSGDIAGTSVSGTISGNFVQLTFAEPVKLSTLQYNVNEVVELIPPVSLYGINPLRLPNGGEISYFRPFGVVCISNNIYQDAASLPAAQVINARPNSFIDIVDSAGESLWHPNNTHYEYDKDTGEITIVDTSAFTAPFEIIDTLSELALVTGVESNQLKIATALQGAFPAGSIVSSVYQLGDLQARFTNVFDQATWNGTWADVIQGEPAAATYNNIAYPIEVINESAINERWAFIFTSDAAFRCIGQNVGQVGTGDILNDFAPINPATGLPYMIVRKQGWGGVGVWQPGNVLFGKSVASSKPAVLVRSVSAGHRAINQDSMRAHFSGNAQ